MGETTLPLLRFEPFLLVVVASCIYYAPVVVCPLLPMAAIADGRSRHLGFLLFNPTCFRLSVVRIRVESYLGLTTGSSQFLSTHATKAIGRAVWASQLRRVGTRLMMLGLL
jgi:hypothetical protein